MISETVSETEFLLVGNSVSNISKFAVRAWRPLERKLIIKIIAKASPTQIAQKSIIMRFKTKITTAKPKSLFSVLDISGVDISPEAITRPKAKITPTSLTEPTGLNPEFFAKLNGRINILRS